MYTTTTTSMLLINKLEFEKRIELVKLRITRKGKIFLGLSFSKDND